jgi:hypothetical protein
VRIKRYHIEHSAQVAASPEAVWQEVTQVDIAAFPHPAYLSLLGIPKPLRAELLRPGAGGVRVAHFSKGRRFAQEITEWRPPERYAFTFTADPGFHVAYVLDLATGPFRMAAGAYTLRRTTHGTSLILSSEYELRGAPGACLHVPVRLVLHLFQAYLLRGIRANAEGAAQRGA